ncbi:hypothetical protein V1511DRAFT_481908 [Dipodascopsis uninucleata]
MAQKLEVLWSDGDRSTFPAGEAVDKTMLADSSYGFYEILDKKSYKYRIFISKVCDQLLHKIGHGECELRRLRWISYAISLLRNIELTLPKDYRIYEYHRYQLGWTSEIKQIAVFGHPSGKKFTSVIQFVQHLFWLSNDIKHDRQNCECRLCSMHNMAFIPKRDLKAISKLQLSRRICTSEKELRREARRILAHEERIEDEIIGGAWFRPGEIVWKKSSSPQLECSSDQVADLWEPVLIHARSSIASAGKTSWTCDEPTYKVFNFDRKEFEEGISEIRLKPWLTMSSAKCNLRASEITESWSVFGKSGSEDEDKLYTGAFLGAEKIWCGDALRLRPQSTGSWNDKNFLEILVVEKIIVKNDTGRLCFAGDVYIPGVSTIQHRSPPRRVEADQNWVITNMDDDIVEVDFDDVLGRWYARNMCLSCIPGFYHKGHSAGVRVTSRRAAIFDSTNL